MSKTENGPFREFVFEEWLREGLEGLRSEMKGKKIEFKTADFRKHLRNASKEQLLAIRSLIDSAIEVIDQRDAEKKA